MKKYVSAFNFTKTDVMKVSLLKYLYFKESKSTIQVTIIITMGLNSWRSIGGIYVIS